MNVLLIGHEWDHNDFRLHRLVEWAGFDLAHFPKAIIKLDHPAPWGDFNSPPPVSLTMGPRAAEAVGIAGSILQYRGYVQAGSIAGHVIPTVSPVYIQRGNARWSAAFINDLQKAVQLSRTGLPPQLLDYRLDPSPLGALQWAQDYTEYLRHHPNTYLAFDIETPGKGEDEDDNDTDSDAPDRTWHIERVGFSYRPYQALSVPWEPTYFAAIRLLLGSVGPKVVWNAGFDVPRIRRSGVAISGTIHDGMVAWHILHTDLPKRLGFVSTFTCPWQPAWKHLSSARPAFYNATDADVELRSMLAIEEELKRADLWHVYQSDVVDLEPILVHMSTMGMPVDAEIRLDRAIKLAERLAEARPEMEQCVPLEARKVAHVYTNTPKDITGLLSRQGLRKINVCSVCGQERPTQHHFRRLVKKPNPCQEGRAIPRTVEVAEYYRLTDFTPSRDQLVRYHNYLKRPCPTVYDPKTRTRKVSFGEKQLKELLLRYPADTLYNAILTYRGLDKLAGTFIGRPVES